MNLLYDQLIDFAKKARRQGTRDESFLRRLKQCSIYELSNVIALFDDRNSNNGQGVPKRPPHEKLWAEWKWFERSETDLEFYNDWTIGCFLMQVPIPDSEEFLKGLRVFKERAISDDTLKAIRECEACFIRRTFARLDRTNDEGLIDLERSIAQRAGTEYCFFADGFRTSRHIVRDLAQSEDGWMELARTWSVFGLPIQFSEIKQSNSLMV